jgi:uncharacterized membrane protein
MKDKLNICRATIPAIAGILFGVFFFDIKKGIRNISAGILVYALFSLFIAALLWFFYSTVTGKRKDLIRNLNSDALTFIPFFILILFPLRYLITLPSKFARFSTLPSYLLLLVSLATFIGMKAYLYRGTFKIKINARKVLFVLIIVYALVFSSLTVLKHLSFNSTAYDLAIYDQTIWGYSRGKMIFNTVRETNLLGDHVHPILFFVAPFYWVYSSPLTLVILQSVVLALGAIPLFLIAKKYLGEKSALLIVLAYFFYPSLQYPNLFDFHPTTFAVTFLFLALYALDEKKYPLMFFSLVLVGMCKEFLPLYLVSFGLFLLFFRKKRKMALFSIAAGLLWTYVNLEIIIPFFSYDSTYFHARGLSYIELLQTKVFSISALKSLIFSKIPFFALLFIPIGLGIFSFIGVKYLALGIFDFAILAFILSSGVEEILYHHQSRMIPVILFSAVLGIKCCRKNMRKTAVVFILTTSILAFLFYGPFTLLYDFNTFNPASGYVSQGRATLQLVPKDVSVAAPNWVLPHLCHREYCFTLSHFLKDSQYIQTEQPPKFIVIDLSEALVDSKRSGMYIDSADISKLFNDRRYGIISSNGTWLLLRLNSSYEKGICEISQFLDKKRYPYLDIQLNDVRCKSI